MSLRRGIVASFALMVAMATMVSLEDAVLMVYSFCNCARACAALLPCGCNSRKVA